MDFSASRFMKSLSSLGRAKAVEVEPEFDVPDDMSERLTRVRDVALAKEAEALHGQLQHMATADMTADADAGEIAPGAEPHLTDEIGQPTNEQEALDAVMSAFLKKLDVADRADAGEEIDAAETEEEEEDEPPLGTLAPMKVRDSNGPLATIKWLASQDAAVWHYVAAHWDWNWGVEPLMWMVKQSDCDAGTAAMLFWKSGADEHYLPFGDAEPTEDDDLLVAELAEKVAARFSDDEFAPMRFAFDEALVLPHFPDRLEALYAEERLEWDASAVPVRSTGELVLIDRFDKVTEAEITRLLSDELMHA